MQRKIPTKDANGVLIERKSGIYMFNNKINGHKYIGKTKDLYNRYREHYYRKDDNYDKEHPKKQLYQAFNKYGFENFDFIIVEQFDEPISEEELSKLEEYYISYYDSYHKGYNASDKSSGGFYTAEHREKCCCILEELNKKQKNFDHPNNKLPEESFKKIIDYAMRGAPERIAWRDLKDEANITEGTFHSVYLGYNYKSLLPEDWDKRPRVYTNAKLWGEEVKQIRDRFKNGEDFESIYKDYKDKISRGVLKDIKRFRTYKNIV